MEAVERCAITRLTRPLLHTPSTHHLIAVGEGERVYDTRSRGASWTGTYSRAADLESHEVFLIISCT